ncbi:hypothetical protein [Leptospira kirschneri]|uniref:hypothetical protein n=1 Tax=Leptospira kirschneri TaxID=29507 RepID=UPI00142F2E53|nr:hypothetical protein [Leptospira kirschneri]
MFYGDFVFKFFSLDSILFALFDILTLFQGRLCSYIFNSLLSKFSFSLVFFRILNNNKGDWF